MEHKRVCSHDAVERKFFITIESKNHNIDYVSSPCFCTSTCARGTIIDIVKRYGPGMYSACIFESSPRNSDKLVYTLDITDCFYSSEWHEIEFENSFQQRCVEDFIFEEWFEDED